MTASMVNTVCLTVFTISLAVGQLLFKQVGLTMRGLPIVDGLTTLARQPTLYAALAIYGFATVLYIWILSRVPLMQAYPWVSAGVVIVPLMGNYFFYEKAPPISWLGALLIILGVVLTQFAVEKI